MMTKSYRILITRRAGKEVDRLPWPVQDRVLDALGRLEKHPRPPGVKKLADRHGYRVRVGAYRIIYTLDDKAFTARVVKVGHRSDVYEE